MILARGVVKLPNMSTPRSPSLRQAGFLGNQTRPLRAALELEQLENRVVLSAGDSIASASLLVFTNASPVVQTAQVSDELDQAASKDFYQLALTHAGNLKVQVDAGGAPVSLTLYD